LAYYKLNQLPKLDGSTPMITYGLRIGRKSVEGMKASGVGVDGVRVSRGRVDVFQVNEARVDGVGVHWL
jgi:hypothetical protein